jgi:protein gp37
VSTATSIEWTETTWNPTTGCDRISPGCDNCYALTLAGRLKAMGQAKYQHDGDPRTSGPGFGVTVHPHVLTEPLRWRKPRKVFVDSMADLSGSAGCVSCWGGVLAAQDGCSRVIGVQQVLRTRLSPTAVWVDAQ